MACLAAPTRAVGDEGEPLDCWWRTSVSAVTVGQPFTLVVTCAVLQTESMTAVVDRARLDPRAIELAPFEVLGGRVAPEVRAGDQLFFQNEYTLRFINDAFFGQDVALPSLAVSYRVQTQGAGRDVATQGMERRFAMPHQMVRIASLVPADAADIRDASSVTFADVDRLSSRGRLLSTTGLLLLGLAAVVAVIGVGRAVGARVSTPAVETGLLGEAAILGGARRALADVRRARDAGSWTVDGVAGALAATRVVTEHALDRRANQRLADARRTPPAGSLVLPRRWRAGEVVLVSGAVTPKSLAVELARRTKDLEPTPPRLEVLQQALTVFTRAEYAPDDGPLDESALDEALASVDRIARRLAIERTWLLKRLTLDAWRRRRRSLRGPAE